MCGHLNRNLPPFMQPQQQRPCRLNSTYPYLQQEVINLPPVICLPDGEELIPCSLQLRHPDQQLELSRATVRPPPNQTVFDIDLIDVYIHSRSLQPLSSNFRTNDTNSRMEGPPPSYSEVMGVSPDSKACPLTNNKSECAQSQTVCNTAISGPESTTKACTNINRWPKTEGNSSALARCGSPLLFFSGLWGRYKQIPGAQLFAHMEQFC